ncbi:MAG: ATP-binding cassette domain-containing protein [Mycoplasmataceae bacterium]|jgi:energy-coupling factor transport system ATP-binding protein|nr:ATP-binding cassette domain-containing protein [Mycoplasmataceae bacterium]
MEKSNCIEIKNLSVVFENEDGTKNVVLENINYAFKKNKLTYILGKSGSGKTVLISHLNGLIKSKKGNIDIDDFKILENSKKIKDIKTLRKKIGAVFQFAEYQLFNDTILKELIFGPKNLGIKKDVAIEKAKKIITEVGLNETYLERAPSDLSGGQKRRVAIASILTSSPEIILFDEPCAGLDPQGEIEIYKIIMDFKNSGKTPIIITQDMDHVLEYGDEVIVLADNKIIAQGTPKQIFRDCYDIIKKNNLEIPKIYKLINELIDQNSIFEKLYDYDIRSTKQLAEAIKEVLKHE